MEPTKTQDPKLIAQRLRQVADILERGDTFYQSGTLNVTSAFGEPLSISEYCIAEETTLRLYGDITFTTRPAEIPTRL